jgi:hypothetical protein
MPLNSANNEKMNKTIINLQKAVSICTQGSMKKDILITSPLLSLINNGYGEFR